MNTDNIREGPEKGEGPWPIATCSTTPDRRDDTPQAAFVYDKDSGLEAQIPAARGRRGASRTRLDAGGVARQRLLVGGVGAFPPSEVKFDTGLVATADGRRVRLVLHGSHDGRRSEWLRNNLLGSSVRSSRQDDDESPDLPAGVKVPTSPVEPEGSVGLEVLV